MIEQFEATSTDGTKIPYFVVRPKDLKYDGTAPTLLYAYGGFQVSMTPAYSATVGKLWLERGGVYVVANIRAAASSGRPGTTRGLKTKRQLIYDDFAAVGPRPDRAQDHQPAPARHRGRLQRRPPDGGWSSTSTRTFGTPW